MFHRSDAQLEADAFASYTKYALEEFAKDVGWDNGGYWRE